MLSTRRKRPSGDGASRTIIAAAPIGCGSPSSGTRIRADCMWYSNSAASVSSLIMSSYVLAGVLRLRVVAAAVNVPLRMEAEAGHLQLRRREGQKRQERQHVLELDLPALA